MKNSENYKKVEIQKNLKKIRIAVQYNMDRAMILVRKEKWKEALIYSKKAEKLLNLESRLIDKEYKIIIKNKAS
jgi:hypothetical protein